MCCAWSPTACATGSRRCGSTASASISRPRSPASRAVRRARELPRRGGQDPVLASVKLIAEPWDTGSAATRSAISRPAGPSGTTSIATRCASSGRATRASCRRWPRASRARPTSTTHRGRRSWASINFVTASRCATWSATTKAQRGQRRQPGRLRQQQQLELRRRGPTDDPEILALRRRQMRNS